MLGVLTTRNFKLRKERRAYWVYILKDEMFREKYEDEDYQKLLLREQRTSDNGDLTEPHDGHI